MKQKTIPEKGNIKSIFDAKAGSLFKNKVTIVSQPASEPIRSRPVPAVRWDYDRVIQRQREVAAAGTGMSSSPRAFERAAAKPQTRLEQLQSRKESIERALADGGKGHHSQPDIWCFEQRLNLARVDSEISREKKR